MKSNIAFLLIVILTMGSCSGSKVWKRNNRRLIRAEFGWNVKDKTPKAGKYRSRNTFKLGGSTKNSYGVPLKYQAKKGY